MFKKFLAVLFVLALTFGIVATPAHAAVPVTYESSIQVRNLTNTAGTITLTFYNLSGTIVGTPLTDSIAANETKSYYRSTMPVDAGFNGSVVISSDVEIAAMSNLVGLNAATTPISYAAYSGFTGGATSAYLPTLSKTIMDTIPSTMSRTLALQTLRLILFILMEQPLVLIQLHLGNRLS